MSLEERGGGTYMPWGHANALAEKNTSSAFLISASRVDARIGISNTLPD